jgi:hypothetical protein
MIITMNRRLAIVLLLITNAATQAFRVRSPEASSPTAQSFQARLLFMHHFDPSCEFLELGVVEGLKTTWKLLGPDMDGTYGGQNGTGGFDAMVPGPELFCPTMGDINGNIHFVYDVGHAHLATNTSRVTGYGAVPGYRPLELGGRGNLVSKHAWRNRAREC